ncbi:hypothetical protein C1646_708943 [Rhizophagus diaphanus]|nr:hypothetical protein C1646_708943 [Rhizophagus diaphanus] [Rhizophagus sp. MUCL 43196]
MQLKFFILIFVSLAVTFAGASPFERRNITNITNIIKDCYNWKTIIHPDLDDDSRQIFEDLRVLAGTADIPTDSVYSDVQKIIDHLSKSAKAKKV